MKLLKMLVVALVTLGLTIPVYDADAASKYKSSSSRSSFSSRPVSKPPVTRPSAPKYSASSSSSKYKSSSSNYSNSSSQQYKTAQAKQQSALAYSAQKQNISPASNSFKQASTTNSSYSNSSTKPTSSSYNSTYKSPPKPQTYSGYNNTTKYPSNTNTVIVRDSGIDLGDVAVAAMVGSMLSDDSAQVAALQNQVNSLQSQVNAGKQQIVGNNTTTAPATTVPLVDKSKLPIVNFCAGPNGQNYATYGAVLSERTTAYQLNVVTTNGSLDNLSKLSSGECDVAIVQRDSYPLALNLPSLHRIASPYADEALLMCSNKSGIYNASQLTKDHKVGLLPITSGSRATWHNISTKLDITPTVVDTPSVQSQLMKLSDGSLDCAFAVTTTTAKVFNLSKTLHMEEKVHLAHIKHSDLDDVLDLADEPVYYDHTIKGSKTFQLKGASTVFGAKVWDTNASSVSVPNDVVMSSKFLENKQDVATSVIADVDSVKL